MAAGIIILLTVIIVLSFIIVLLTFIIVLLTVIIVLLTVIIVLFSAIIGFLAGVEAGTGGSGGVQVSVPGSSAVSEGVLDFSLARA